MGCTADSPSREVPRTVGLARCAPFFVWRPRARPRGPARVFFSREIRTERASPRPPSPAFVSGERRQDCHRPVGTPVAIESSPLAILARQIADTEPSVRSRPEREKTIAQVFWTTT
ncbi:uncharacterized protein LOC112464053 [Temnothorax curvispinosus]|uniref:Uncharacterized protein LOC112464053 n=1 Tax=Temnothorax curvispinosus TaxID=300111 RepID=A0A6J1QXK9_9HYME|nr:uncharacterized protein LOC112464053 [Temnothorax curvispinosus]